MIELTDKALLNFNKIGLIPGPNETPDFFAKRAEYCLHLKDNLSDELKACLDAEASAQSDTLNSATHSLAKDYDISPAWVPLFYSNYRLPFWHGGCAWIYQLTEETPTAALIQLRSHFRKSPRYLGIYEQQELLTHELCHIGRMAFQEEKYEEVLAYGTSSSRFRRWLGPLVQSSIESVIFLLVIFMLVVFDVFLITMNHSDAYMMALWLKIIPVTLVVIALYRLWKRQKTFKKTVSNLTEIVGEQANAVIYRLTDKEISSFAKMSTQQIKEYAATQPTDDLRWQVIKKAYF